MLPFTTRFSGFATFTAPDVIPAMRKRAMQQYFSWNTSAKKYIDVYRWAKKH
jgi:glycogen synthase